MLTMLTKLFRERFAKRSIALFIIFVIYAVTQLAFAREYVCECTFLVSGVRYDVGYVATAGSSGGCCTGSVSVALVTKKQNGTVIEEGYVEGGLGQSFCCRDQMPNPE